MISSLQGAEKSNLHKYPSKAPEQVTEGADLRNHVQEGKKAALLGWGLGLAAWYSKVLTYKTLASKKTQRGAVTGLEAPGSLLTTYKEFSLMG